MICLGKIQWKIVHGLSNRSNRSVCYQQAPLPDILDGVLSMCKLYWNINTIPMQVGLTLLSFLLPHLLLLTPEEVSERPVVDGRTSLVPNLPRQPEPSLTSVGIPGPGDGRAHWQVQPPSVSVWIHVSVYVHNLERGDKEPVCDCLRQLAALTELTEHVWTVTFLLYLRSWKFMYYWQSQHSLFYFCFSCNFLLLSYIMYVVAKLSFNSANTELAGREWEWEGDAACTLAG